MYAILDTILTPITVPMAFLLNLYASMFGSPGVAIVALSLTFSVLMIPVSIWARGLELRTMAKTEQVRRELAARRGALKGEALFNLTEKIYTDNGYHPIQTMLVGAGLLVMLPVLLSSIIVITTSPLMVGTPFLLVQDLSRPDGMLFMGINLLPLVMFAITLIDALLRFRESPGEIVKFCTISVVLLILVYGLASGLVIYWITNNLFALAMAALRSPTRREQPQ